MDRDAGCLGALANDGVMVTVVLVVTVTDGGVQTRWLLALGVMTLYY